MSPADTVIQLFGGVRPTARVVGVYPSAVTRWRKRGGGKIPQGHFPVLLREASLMGFCLTMDHLVRGSSRRIIKTEPVGDAFSRMTKDLERMS